MAELIETKEKQEKVILVGVSVRDGDDTEKSLLELKELANTAGAIVSGMIIQNREAVSSATYVGKGKIDEIAELLKTTGADGIICDDELSPAQMNNLSDALNVKIMDRTMLILDIFAKHATTSEGKLQVELAQLKYRSSRLVGANSSLSRVSYGIGMRGPGEKKLEVDRRLIRSRMAELKGQLDEVERSRGVTRQLRQKGSVPVIAIVGYTNAGKSTLLNRLTGSKALEADMLFATLDPTTRCSELERGQVVLFTDTVGFIRKLPHHLIEAFGSTLEEAKYADVILHVIDASDMEADVKMHVVYDTLRRLGISDKPVIAVFNKNDMVFWNEPVRDMIAEERVSISAKTGEGIPELLETIETVLRKQKMYFEGTVGYGNAAFLAQIRKGGQMISEDYNEDGIFVKAYVSPEVFGRLTGLEGKKSE
ncbi:MAG: GTPase HflX [Lachnospiraceae bacterium]|nr:GTPase HflX [Lachnospiraceae bacterium]